MTFLRLITIAVLVVFTAACAEPPDQQTRSTPEDIFSYANFDQVTVRHIDLDLEVLFEEKALEGSAELTLDMVDGEASRLVLDSRDLTIYAVEALAAGLWRETPFTLGQRDPLLGQSLTIDLPEETSKVRIFYRTSPEASGLMWLSPEQTAGGKYPFMFSQSQTIHARSWAPLQDTPAVRFTYRAAIRTPAELIALMSSAQDRDGVRDGEYFFDMPQAIPSYLMAIAVGDLEFREISGNIGVYAESYIVDAAAEEFSETPLMMAANEALYGPYRWGRFDILVLPPSFPFGGMENPRLTFLTPTLIAGDKSLTNVVAHELAHSWAGNQVTNATWREPWLNEGFTSYVENRVMEVVYGRERAVMEQVLSKAGWLAELAGIEDPAMTALVLPAEFANPDEGFSNVPYVKGQFFMMFLEEAYGREAFDPFLKSYFDHFAFQSITTEDFLEYLKENLMDKNPGVVKQAVIMEWLYQPGVPATTPSPASKVFDRVDEIRAAWLAGDLDPAGLGTDAWITHEWLRFINGLPGDLALDQFGALDSAFALSVSANAEIAFAWYMKSLEGGYQEVTEPLRAFLIRVGRGKFIYRLYERLAETGQKDWALEVYKEARPGYHPIAQARIDGILAE
ncbi:MAG: M1 family metallopeptidase [Proteobacteria bacterium]|nr:M1 family metallopeptidase [Pseudomonadota bacterium]